MKYLKRLKARNWAWMHFLFVVGILWNAFMLNTPPELIIGVLNPSILATATVVSMLGTLVAIAGYAASQQLGKPGVIGVSIELSGLVLSVVGPASYFITRFYMLFSPGSEGVFNSPLYFSYALCAVFLYRLIIVIPRFRFEARDPNKE